MINKKNSDEFTSYLSDASNYKGFADELYIPADFDELERIITECGKINKNITIRGAGTSTTGSSAPNGGVIISMEKLNTVLDFDLTNKTIVVQSGITLKELDDYLSPFGLYLPVDPTEKNATIGGNISTNASGAKSYKYGSIINHIEQIKICCMNDNYTLTNHHYIIEYIYNKTILKNASGYLLDNNCGFLFGSEGTLGVIKEVKIKLKDKPENSLMFLVFFENNDDLLSALKSLKSIDINPMLKHGVDNSNLQISSKTFLDPCLIEYFDYNSLKLLSKGIPNIPENAISALWIEQECSNSEVNDLLDLWFEFFADIIPLVNETITFIDEASKRKFVELRHSIPEHINEKISSYGTIKVASDTAVPDVNFKEHFVFINNLMENQKLESFIFGHIGNSHLHCNIIPKNENDIKTAKELVDQINYHAISLNGTISAEHGIGKIKNRYFKKMISQEELKKMLNIKNKFDPNSIFGNGNIF
ncbi:MAG: FAD-binding oxidoreductase [bacterium]